MSLSAGIRYDINQRRRPVGDERGGRRTAPTHYVFGRIDQTTVAMTLRFNYTMTPNLSLQTYAEPFVSAGDYTNFRELVDGRAAGLRATGTQPYAYTGDASTSTSARSGRPTCCGGSTSRARRSSSSGSRAGASDSTTYGNFDFTRDFDGVFSAPSQERRSW